MCASGYALFRAPRRKRPHGMSTMPDLLAANNGGMSNFDASGAVSVRLDHGESRKADMQLASTRLVVQSFRMACITQRS